MMVAFLLRNLNILEYCTNNLRHFLEFLGFVPLPCKMLGRKEKESFLEQ